jgi:SsrA-binding protein
MTGMLLAKNRSALYEHSLVKEFTAGIVLKGYEVKALREKKAAFDSAYVLVMKGEAFIVNMSIGAYSKQSQEVSTLESRRSRKLLLNKAEIAELTRELSEKGRTAIPLALVMLNNRVKLEFAVVKGKKEFEKKEVAKERQIKKDLEMETKLYTRTVD